MRLIRFLTLLVCAGLTGFNQTYAQHQSGSSPAKPGGITVFTSAHVKPYLFELPASGEINEKLVDETILTAKVKNHLLHGNWQSYYKFSQKLDEGNLVKGIPDGVWQVWYPNGQLKAIRTYSASLYASILQDVDLHHPKLSRFAITDWYKKEGNSIMKVFKASYSFSNKNDFGFYTPVELVRQNQQHPHEYHPPFSNALHHGLYMNYFENGIVKDSGYYKEGLRNGLWIHSLNDGTYWRGIYKNGIQINDWKYYSSEGKLQLFIHYNQAGREEFRKKF